MNYFGNTTYYLVACHDWSFIFPATGGGWDPKANWHVDPLYYSYNLLKNTHMQCTDTSGRAADCGYGGTCTNLTPWAPYGNVSWTFNQVLMGPTRSANCALRFSTASSPNGESFYQDVSTVPDNYVNYTFGVALRGPNNNGDDQNASVVVFEVGNVGNIIAVHNVSANVQRQTRFFKGSFSKSPETRSLRFQVYINNKDQSYEMTDAWIAPEPA